MKFNFNLKGRQPAGTRYTFFKAGATANAGLPAKAENPVKAELPATQGELYRKLLSVFLTASSEAPEEARKELTLLREAIHNSDPEFLAELAILLREQKNFRDLAFLLTAELAALYGNDEKTGLLLGRIVQQPGEIPGWLEYYTQAAKNGQRPGRAVRKSLSALFNRLDEYQFGRYSRDKQAGLRQALQWLQPKAAGRPQKTLLARILRDQVPVRVTWEQEWHALHQQHYEGPEQRQVALRDKWKEGISSFRIGYTALLDNLQPMLCAGVSGKVLKLAAEYLGNAAAAGPAGQSPLRLLEVYRSLQRMDQGGAGMLSEALEQAALHNSWNRSDFGRPAVSLIAMDVSNSMKRPVSGYTHVQRFDIGPLLAFSWQNRGQQVIPGIIGNTWKPLEGPVRPILSAVDQFRRREGEAGYAINAWLVLQDLLRKRQVVGKVLIFTDCPLWDNRTFNQPAGTDLSDWWRQYRRQIAPEAKLYLFNLSGYGAKVAVLPEDGVYLIDGWQERILDTLEMLENNPYK
jgi:60 kDa SS-A/Ro ribonucleoprotein